MCVVGKKCFVVFYVFSFPAGVYAGTLNLIASIPDPSILTLLSGDTRQARHFYLAKQFCFLDADCLLVGESQGSSRRLVERYRVQPTRPEGDSQTNGTYRCRNH